MGGREKKNQCADTEGNAQAFLFPKNDPQVNKQGDGKRVGERKMTDESGDLRRTERDAQGTRNGQPSGNFQFSEKQVQDGRTNHDAQQHERVQYAYRVIGEAE